MILVYSNIPASYVAFVAFVHQIGKMWESVKKAEAEKKENDEGTPLKQKLDAFGDLLAQVQLKSQTTP